MTNPESELLAEKGRLMNRIAQWTQNGNNRTLPGLWLYQRQAPSERTHIIQQPSVCLIGQGSKQLFWGTETLLYDRDHLLVTSIDVPVAARVLDATPEKPYMGLAFPIVQKDIAQLLAEGNLPLPPGPPRPGAMAVGTLTLPVVQAFLGYIDLLDEPDSIPFLAPSRSREILYRLLTGEEGSILRQVGTLGSQSAQVHRAVEWMMTHLNHPMTIENLARYCQMSESSLHHHFRKLTAMSPLQYQKWIRLQEARRLMLVEGLDVTRVAFAVGYESSSQFCREYGRQFGESPARDIKALRASA